MYVLHGVDQSSSLKSNPLKYWLNLRNWYDDYMRKNNLTPKTLSGPDRMCYETVQARIEHEVKRKLKQE
jgi:hypothetical protein